MKHLREIWTYRFFIINSIKNEFMVKFVRSKLGLFWMILHPIAQVAVYALVLSTVLAAKLKGIESQYAYALYLMAGFLAWSLFSDIVTKSLNIFVENDNLIKKLSFPKIALPIITAGSSLVSNILLLCAIIFIFTLMGHFITSALIWIPFLTLLVLALAMGVGLILGILNVFIRDIGQITPILLQFWFWLTPIVYVIDMLPPSYKIFFEINPLTSIVNAYQSILLYGKAPEFISLTYPVILSILLLITALYIYVRSSEEMADVL